MKILVTGARDWDDYEAVAEPLRKLKDFGDNHLVIQGGALGADEMAKRIACELGMECHTEEADWTKHGKAAGPIRNGRMVAMNPDVVLAFNDDLDASPGTRDCVNQALAKGHQVVLFGHVDGKIVKKVLAPGGE